MYVCMYVYMYTNTLHTYTLHVSLHLRYYYQFASLYVSSCLLFFMCRCPCTA